MESAFAGYHPAVNLLFFTGAVTAAMFVTHPLFLCISAGAALLYYLLLTGRQGLLQAGGLVLLSWGIALINPLFNTMGATVLFVYWGGRSFTLESLVYGMAAGGMFLSVMLWFSCYNRIMTSEKFFYLFGQWIPALSLLLCMVLRMIPRFQIRARVMIGARRSIGKTPENGTWMERLHNSLALLSALTSWALEGSVTTADAMRSRGYGTAKRTCYAFYRMAMRDWVALSVLALAALLVAVCVSQGATAVTFLPRLSFCCLNPWVILGAVGYAAFLLMPSAIHLWEDFIWYILRSRI